MISEQALQEFLAIWDEEKGTPISREKAVEEAINLLTFYNVVYRPVKREWLEQYFAAHPEDKDDYEKREQNKIV